MSKVRAKFDCHYIEKLEGGGLIVHMNAVTSGSEENEQFSEYTPGGNLSIQIDKGKAKTFFEQGKEYFLDFSEA